VIGPTPGAMAIATITVMLWILWSDTLRARRPSQILYAVRIALFLIVTGLLILNMVRRPELYAGGSRTLTVIAALTGIVGAGYFGRRLVLRK
jgi:low affinity Fe/Cu permease